MPYNVTLSTTWAYLRKYVTNNTTHARAVCFIQLYAGFAQGLGVIEEKSLH